MRGYPYRTSVARGEGGLAYMWTNADKGDGS